METNLAKLKELGAHAHWSDRQQDLFIHHLGAIKQAHEEKITQYLQVIKAKEAQINYLKNQKDTPVLEKSETDNVFKDKLLANVSHELRTPLNAIIGMGHLLSNTTLCKQQEHFVNVTKTAADHLLLLVNDLLELTSIQERTITFQSQPFSTQHLLAELHSIIWFKTHQKKLTLFFKEAEELPEYLIGDVTRIHQILTNLLSNATKFTHQGKVELFTNVISKQKDKIYIEWQISDTGIGIAKDKLPHLFESFSQLHGNKEEVYVGTGAGLIIVKTLVELMGGAISVKSELGKGTSFSIVIPFEIPDEIAIQRHLSKQSQTSEESLKGKKILYIEDNHANILYMKNMLADQPIIFEAVEDLLTATKHLNRTKYDCILSDVKLPEGNGIDYIAELRKDKEAHNHKTPVIVITAGATDSERQKARQIGIEGYISKPFSPDVLFKELSKIFDKKEDIKSLLAFYPEPKYLMSENTIEEDYLKHLTKVMNGNKKGMLEMIDIFLKQLPDSTHKMEVAVNNRDWQQVHFEAHKVKSTIGIIGLSELLPVILSINENTRELKYLETIPNLFAQFKKQGKIELKKLIQERKKLSKALSAKKV